MFYSVSSLNCSYFNTESNVVRIIPVLGRVRLVRPKKESFFVIVGPNTLKFNKKLRAERIKLDNCLKIVLVISFLNHYLNMVPKFGLL